MARVIRAVVEVGVPDGITEKALVWKLKHILRYPMQLGHPGDVTTLRKAEIKSYSRVRAAEKTREDTSHLPASRGD